MRGVIAVALASVLGAGCAAYFHGRSETAHQWVKEGALLVDVRSPDEFKGGHLEGARNIPVGELEQRLAELGPKNTRIVVYCHTGLRASRAKGILKNDGFTEVFSLGAMAAW